MPRRDLAMYVALFLLALALRARDVSNPPVYTGDESYHVPAAKQFVASGQTEDTTWSQPPLALVLLGGTIALVGDGPWGWRLRSVVLGALTAVAVALLGAALYPDRRRVGWIAGVLLALDPLHVLLSRSTLEEVQTACFFVLAAWIAVESVRTGRRGLVLAGALLGCAHASKAYYHVAALVLLGAVLVALRRRGEPAWASIHAIVCFTVVPATVYLAAYLPWFGRGYGLAEFFEVQRAAWRGLAGKTLETFANGPLLAMGGSPASWFLRPALFGFRLPAPDGLRVVLFAKNLVTWLPVLPALGFIAWRARARRELGDVLLLALIAATYVPLLLLARPIFLYSAVAVLPLAFLALGRALEAVLEGPCCTAGVVG
jgi:dolichyl-phosphate-mannose-protein mannosyltransferase